MSGREGCGRRGFGAYVRVHSAEAASRSFFVLRVF